MAGSQDPSDNPVAINVVPLVDIIFCLCVFFMCSFKFRQLEGRFDTWLPKTEGPGEPPPPDVFLSPVRVAILWDEATQTVTRKFGSRTYADDGELARAIREQHDAWAARGKPGVPVTIDADGRAPWSEIMRVVDLLSGAHLGPVEFAAGAAPVRGGARR